MSQQIKNATAMDLIYLVSCAVNELKPSPERCAAMDLEAVLRLAKRHMLTVVSAFALEKTFPLPVSWKDAKATAIRRMIIFDSERAKVLRALDEDGIWYLPLKGIVLKNSYPKASMREMSDNDILCDSNRMADIRNSMIGLGYSYKSSGRSNHDVYHKDSLSFEIHKTLFLPNLFPLFDVYYENLKDRLIKDSDNRFGYHMRDEDFYIYLLCHMYKHYEDFGLGLRSLLDVYVFCKQKEQLLDWEYIGNELEKLEIKGMEHDMRTLALKIFSFRSLSESEWAQISYFIDSGCHGSFSTFFSRKLNNDDSKKAKIRYAFSRIFPDADYLKVYYPTVYRHRILYPFLVLCRPIKGLLKKPKELSSEYKNLKQYRKKESFNSEEKSLLTKE